MPNKIVIFAALVLLFQQAESTSGFSYNALDSEANPFIAADFKAYGSGFVNGSGFMLTQQGDTYGTIIFYNSSVNLGNGFYTEFTIQITNCDNGPYGGADGFAFVVFPQLPLPFYVPGGSNIGITTSSNLAAVGFLLVNDILTVCAANSTSNFGGGSLSDDTTHCIQNTTMNNILKDLRCNGTHAISIAFRRPGDWEIVIDRTYTYTFTKDIVSILNWTSEYTGYVGFAGGVGAGWMDQRIVGWDFGTYSGCEGACATNANCDDSTSNPICSCPAGFAGDGISQCIPIKTSANIVPILECFEKYGDGLYEAYYGYDSKENEPVVIPKGDNNKFFGYNGTIDPTELFLPGRSSFYPSNAFLAEFTLPNSDPITLTWHLGNYEVSFSTDDNSKRCSPNLGVLLRFTTGRQVDANEASLILDQLYDLLELSFGRLSLRNITYSPINTKRQSGLDLAELELEISGTNSTTQNEPRASQVVQNLINASSNTTRMNEVVNPDPDNQDPDRTFVGVKTTSSGVETVGQVQTQPVGDTNTTPIVTSSATLRSIGLGNIILFWVVYLFVFP